MGPQAQRNHRILIVDDQEEIHDDFAEMLKPHLIEAATDEFAAAFAVEQDKTFLPDFELLHARSGEEACAVIEDARASGRPVAVAYVDIRMPPGIDGVETVRRMRKSDRDVEIVIMTAYTDRSLPDIVHDMELLHKLLYIRKPFTREEIQQITMSLAQKWNVERALDERRAQLAASHQRLEAVLDATGDAMAMYDEDGRLVFANRGFAELLDLDEGALRKIPRGALEARFSERFREPALSDAEGRSLVEEGGDLVETADGIPKKRLYYRSTAPVRGGGETVIGRLIVYRDVSKDIEAERMKAEVLRLREELETSYAFEGMIGDSPEMKTVYALIAQAAESDITVLIRGESGTGKELVAQSFHFNGPRKDGPFVTVNCAALPEPLIESELFGHEKGAFTGATQRRRGAFERAEGGTLLLDEVGAMQFELQSKLLRVLQEREISRVGGSAVVPVDVRVIAATNHDLEDAIRRGAFREDLFYRLAAFPITIPPLRKRREDIPLLASHFLAKYAERHGKSIDGFSHAALSALLQYDWPGNVRELENAVQRAVLLETGKVAQAGSLPPEVSPVAAASSDRQAAPSGILPLAEVERQAIVRALEANGGNVSEAARVLGIDRATLYRKLKRYDQSTRNPAS